MMTQPFTCDDVAERLADYLERDLDEAARAAVDAHAALCTSCGALLADLRDLRTDAASLADLAPEHDLWRGIAARIAAPVVPLDSHAAADVRPARRRALAGAPRWTLLGAAAAALVLISVGTTWLAMRDRSAPRTSARVASVTPSVSTPAPLDSTAPGSPRRDAGAGSAPAVAIDSGIATQPRSAARLASTTTHKPSAEETYGREIATLRAAVASRRPLLDTATVAVIEKNLAVIDSAIAQCRAALARDPSSGFLLQSLNSALESKVELLRTAAMLPAHT